MADGEMFLGGFASGFLARGITHIGYGIYFTTSRLIGIDLGANGGGALGGTMAGFTTVNSCHSFLQTRVTRR